MKVILYMTVTTNGMIAHKGKRATFISKESSESLDKLAQETQCVIYGRKSYDAEPIEGVLNVVLTHNETLKSDKKEFVFMSGEPAEVLSRLEKDGYQSVLLVGGAQTNKEFIEAGLVDEIYLDVEPVILGDGIPLFAPSDFEYKLELLETKDLSPQTIQLHYKVIK